MCVKKSKCEEERPSWPRLCTRGISRRSKETSRTTKVLACPQGCCCPCRAAHLTFPCAGDVRLAGMHSRCPTEVTRELTSRHFIASWKTAPCRAAPVWCSAGTRMRSSKFWVQHFGKLPLPTQGWKKNELLHKDGVFVYFYSIKGKMQGLNQMTAWKCIFYNIQGPDRFPAHRRDQAVLLHQMSAYLIPQNGGNDSVRAVPAVLEISLS